jgi:hypothetical protein
MARTFVAGTSTRIARDEGERTFFRPRLKPSRPHHSVGRDRVAKRASAAAWRCPDMLQAGLAQHARDAGQPKVYFTLASGPFQQDWIAGERPEGRVKDRFGKALLLT